MEDARYFLKHIYYQLKRLVGGNGESSSNLEDIKSELVTLNSTEINSQDYLQTIDDSLDSMNTNINTMRTDITTIKGYDLSIQNSNTNISQVLGRSSYETTMGDYTYIAGYPNSLSALLTLITSPSTVRLQIARIYLKNIGETGNIFIHNSNSPNYPVTLKPGDELEWFFPVGYLPTSNLGRYTMGADLGAVIRVFYIAM